MKVKLILILLFIMSNTFAIAGDISESDIIKNDFRHLKEDFKKLDESYKTKIANLEKKYQERLKNQCDIQNERIQSFKTIFITIGSLIGVIVIVIQIFESLRSNNNDKIRILFYEKEEEISNKISRFENELDEYVAEFKDNIRKKPRTFFD